MSINNQVESSMQKFNKFLIATGALIASFTPSTVMAMQCANPTVPIINWVADASIIEASQTSSSSFGWELVPDFNKQIQSYNSGKTPFVRGTMSMIVESFYEFNEEPRPFLKLSWSIGDAIVSTKTLTKGASLRIALQEKGPHTAFVARIAKDLELDLDLTFTKELNDGIALMKAGKVDAAALIMPDALVATGGESVGSGAEDSVKGAKIVFSTVEATTLIPDMLFVNPKYAKDCIGELKDLRNSILNTASKLRQEMKLPYGESEVGKRIASSINDDILPTVKMSDEEAHVAWGDAIIDDIQTNVHFFDKSNTRGFAKIVEETSQNLLDFGITDNEIYLTPVVWADEGIKGVNSIQADVDTRKSKREIRKARATKSIDEMTRITYDIFFDPSTEQFPVSQYAEDFEAIAEFMQVYTGAMVVAEGHVDGLEYQRLVKAGEPDNVLKAAIKNSKNLSMNRLVALQKALKDYNVDKSRFILEPLGHSDNTHPIAKTEQQWRENMKVALRLVVVSAEALSFKPLDAN